MNKRNFIHRILESFNHKVVRLFLAVLFLVVLTLVVGRLSGAFVGFPKGYDSFDHLALGQIIKENFPHVFWNPYWDEGSVLFPRNYPPLFHFLVGLLARVLSLEVTRVAIVVLGLSIILTAFFIFLTIFFLTKRISLGLFASLFFLASSTVWCYILEDGLYPRVLAMMTVSMVVFSLVVYFSRTNRTYELVVFSFVLAFLSHFLAVFLASFSFLVLLYFWRGERQEKINQGLRVFLPVLGLTAFYYLPVLILQPGRLGLVSGFGGEKYEPWAFLSFFKQGYPGLPFMSIPLGLFVFVLVILLRDKIIQKKREIYKIFLGFGILVLFCLFYVLGAYKLFFYGIYPGQFLLPSVFYLSLFLGLGLFFLEDLRIIKKTLFLVLLVGLVAMALIQTPKLKKLVIDQSKVYPKVAFKGTDKKRLYRYGHREEVLGGAFNFYSQTLQTRGYFEPGVIHPDFQRWFEEGVFMTFDNPVETEFLLDWYGVRNFYIYSRDLQKKGEMEGLRQKFASGEDFAQVANDQFEYKKATPIILATQAPVMLFKKGDREYLEFLLDLAKKGIDSRTLIPIRLRQAQPSDFSTQVIDSPEEVGSLVDGNFESQKPEFVNSQKRVIELREPFSGVLLKESYFPNWRARLEKVEDGRQKTEDLPIYFAGPGMMYASLPKNYSLPARVVFEYKIGLIEKVGLAISIMTLGGMIIKGLGFRG